MKKLHIMLLTMLFCVVFAYAQSNEGDGNSTSTGVPMKYKVLRSNFEGVANLFDGDYTTKGGSGYVPSEGNYIVFKTSFSLVPTHYIMTTPDDARSHSLWKQWQLYGMNADNDEDVTRESENWVLLDVQYNVSWDQLPDADYSSVTFSLSKENTTAYRYFKIELENGGEMADFLLDGINTILSFSDANVKAICVSHWDTDGNGEST